MSYEVEKEQTFTLNRMPQDLSDWEVEFLADTYIPEDAVNPQIRLRQRGNAYFITKKYPKNEGDLSEMIEETISLSEDEYKYFRKYLPGKYLAKNRYKKIIDDIVIEIDEYQDQLAPLIVLDMEWTTKKPNQELIGTFDIAQDITQINELAGGRLAGKSYEEIRQFISS